MKLKEKLRKILVLMGIKKKRKIEEFRAGGGIAGEGTEIYPDVFFGSEPYLITIGSNCRITYGVKFATHDGGVWTLRKNGILEDADIFGRITIGDNTNIGWNAIIMPGVSIGKNCVIGAGAVVTKDIPDNSVAAGVPAKVIETLDEYMEKIEQKAVMTKHMNPDEKRKFLEKSII